MPAIIKSEKEHSQALEVVKSMMDQAPDNGTWLGDQLQVFALVIEEYEKIHYPIGGNEEESE